MTRVRRNRTLSVRPVTLRTAKRRARLAEQSAATEMAKKRLEVRRAERPETLGQARVWQRKCGRYQIAGLCHRCAAQAAYGHAEGFQNIKDPCEECQSTVDTFPTPGPRGSKWRKILSKLEYMSEIELAEWFDSLDA